MAPTFRVGVALAAVKAASAFVAAPPSGARASTPRRPSAIPPSWPGTTFPDDDITCDEDACLVTPDVEEDVEAARQALFAETLPFDATLAALPVGVPFVALMTYEPIARAARDALDFFGQRNTWASVDGNAYQIAILAPVVNGIVLPSVSIALGTLTAATVSALRQRQVDVRSAMNAELAHLEVLRTCITTLLPEDDDDVQQSSGRGRRHPDEAIALRLFALAREYVSRLAREASPRFDAATARAGDHELADMVELVLQLEKDSRAARRLDATVDALLEKRAERLAKLAAPYAPAHYAILALCAGSIIVAFLIESDQEILRFLDSIQLRILFAILVGACAGIAALVADLADLHRGTSRITPVAAQLFALRDQLTYDLCCRPGGPEILVVVRRRGAAAGPSSDEADLVGGGGGARDDDRLPVGDPLLEGDPRPSSSSSRRKTPLVVLADGASPPGNNLTASWDYAASPREAATSQKTSVF